MKGFYPVRRRRGMRGLGYPVLPDSFVTGAGISESFSPQTPDAVMMSILQSQGQQLPADLAAKWASAQSGTPSPSSSPANPAPGALTPSGQPVSTQTGQTVSLLSTIAVAPGVWRCVMSDGSSRYCDANQKQINYTPPLPPVTTPAAGSQPTSNVAPTVTTYPQTGITAGVTPVAVTPSGGQISTTTGTPATSIVPAAAQSTLDSLMSWLHGSLIGGIPNWLLLGGAATALFMFNEGGSSGRKR